MKPRGHDDGFLHAPDATNDSPEDKVAVLDLQIFDFGLKAQVHQEEKYSRQSFAFSPQSRHYTSTLDSPHGDVHVLKSPVNRWGVYTIVKASLSEVTSAFVHNRADLAWKALSVVLEMDAPDYISETVSAHTEPIIHTINTYQRLQSRLLSAARGCVYQTLCKTLWKTSPYFQIHITPIHDSHLIRIRSQNRNSSRDSCARSLKNSPLHP